MNGSFQVRPWGDTNLIRATAGVFSMTSASSELLGVPNSEVVAQCSQINFNAFDGSSIYSGSSVQVQALQALACIRT